MVDHLIVEGYSNIAVLDVSATALAHARDRLEARAGNVEWIEADITDFQPRRQYRLWHDRAVFHFLTDRGDREKYLRVLEKTLQADGDLIIMSFAVGGPTKCSGLDIVQYDVNKLQAQLGNGFELVETGSEVHVTPTGKEQKFEYFHFKRHPG